MRSFISIIILFSFLLPDIANSRDEFPWAMFSAAINNPFGTYGNAPQCWEDVSRNHHINTAIYANSALSYLLLENKERPLVYPALGVAKEHMRDASLNLEQVMNYGILKFSDYCITCKPEFYLDAARELIRLSRIVYARPDYGEFNGLVDSVIYWFEEEPKKYCGVYARQVTLPTWLPGSWWEFGELDSGGHHAKCGDQPRTGPFTLSPNDTGPYGRVIDGCRGTESFYWLLGEELVFVNAYGRITSILSRGNPPDGSQTSYLVGKHFIPPGGTQYIWKKFPITWKGTGTSTDSLSRPGYGSASCPSTATWEITLTAGGGLYGKYSNSDPQVAWFSGSTIQCIESSYDYGKHEIWFSGSHSNGHFEISKSDLYYDYTHAMFRGPGTKIEGYYDANSIYTDPKYSYSDNCITGTCTIEHEFNIFDNSYK